MKKTIASLAILASTQSAVAMIGPHDPNAPQPEINKVCLKTYSLGDGSKVGSCDATSINKGRLLANGCKVGQVAITIVGANPISACLPPGFAQL